MDLSSMFESLKTTLLEALPDILIALLVLVALWIAAVVVRAIIRKTLGMVGLNELVRSNAGGKMDLEGNIAKGVYYLILVLALIAFFDKLRLPLVSEPLQALVEQVLTYLPHLIAGGFLMFLAWVLATVLKKLATMALESTELDDKLSAEAGMRPMSESLANVLYGLVILVFLPAILGAFRLEGLLVPVQGMVDKILNMVPNIFAAVVWGAVGWFVASLLRNLVTNLLTATGADRLGEKAGLAGTMSLSRLVGLVVFIFVFVPALIQALNTLQAETISRPATEMLGAFMGAIPGLFAAAAILAVAFVLARFVGGLITNLLGGIGFDRLPAKLGLQAAFPDDRSPSRLAGNIAVFFIVLFATVEAATVMGFDQVSGMVTVFIQFGSQVLLGVVIIAVGLWISNLAHQALSRMDRPNASFMAGLVRFAILGIVFAMGLRAMDIAETVVNMAFGFTIGAIAVAVALAFGLGGREAAGRQMEYLLARFRGER